MSEARVEPHTLTPLIIALVMGMALTVLGGYYITLTYPPTGFSDLMHDLLFYLFIPTLASLVGYLLGWGMKKRAVTYVAPDWKFESVELSIDECEHLYHHYPKRYPSLIAVSNILYYTIPPFLIIFSLAFPLYLTEYGSSYLWILPHVFAPALGLIFLVSLIGSYRATSNVASADFTVPLFREILWLAREQGKVPGVERVSIYVDRAMFDQYEIFTQPRVIIRVEGLGESAMIKSLTTDNGSITRVLMWVQPPDGSNEILWSWEARDREFWKQSEPGGFGYYVRRPIPSLFKEIGVKDVKLVTENAIAITIIEWLKLTGDNPELRKVLGSLGVPPEEIDSRL
ncbi:MAG: hypothetical protein K9W43_03690 [Candidatus Thorarchaeota archaeon]|nr:hypothetical protein [Candidatus Thorarchaeota archaeon]